MRYFARECVGLLPVLSLLILAGCARYHSLPLPAAPDLSRVPTLTVPVTRLNVPGLAPHAIPADGLDEITVMSCVHTSNDGN